MSEIPRAKPSEVRAFFTAEDGSGLVYPPITMSELRDLKESRDGADYDQIVHGIADGSLTY